MIDYTKRLYIDTKLLLVEPMFPWQPCIALATGSKCEDQWTLLTEMQYMYRFTACFQQYVLVLL